MAYIEDTNLVEEIKSLRISVGGKDVFPDEAKESVLRIISEQPTADVVEVKHGEWENFEIPHMMRCSECGVSDLDIHRTKFAFCPYCCADMRGAKDE